MGGGKKPEPGLATPRGRGIGEGAGRGVCGVGGRRPRERKAGAGAGAQVLTVSSVSFPGSWGGGPPCLPGPPRQLGLPVGQGRDWGARRGRVVGARPGAGAGSGGRAARKARDPVSKGLLLGTR